MWFTISGYLTSLITLTIMGFHSIHDFLTSHHFLCLIGRSDFETLKPEDVIIDGDYPSTNVCIFIANDEITLEYEDRVLLRFTPTHANLIPGLERNFEYIRDTAVVNIIDSDRKCPFHFTMST